MDAVKLMGQVIKEDRAAHRGQRRPGACAKLVVFANAVEDNPFMAGAFHGVGEGDAAINVGVSGPGVVQARAGGRARASPSTWWPRPSSAPHSRSPAWASWWRRRPVRRLDVPFGIVDLSLAPTPGDGRFAWRTSWRRWGWRSCGTHGTTAALALLNDAVKKGGVMASSHVGGLSGAFIPVSEDVGHDRRRRQRHADAGKARGDDLRLLGRAWT